MKIEYSNINQWALKYKGLIKIIEIIILGLTLTFAIMIGIRQNNINQNLLDLNYAPSVEIVYENHQIRILNRGDKNIFIGAMAFYDKFSKDGKINLDDKEVRLITPGGLYFFPADCLDATIEKYKQEYVNQNEEIVIPFDVFLKGLNDKKYVAKNFLYLSFKNKVPSIRTQTFSIIPNNW